MKIIKSTSFPEIIDADQLSMHDQGSRGAADMKIKPCGYFVLVKVDIAEEVTAGGILLPSDLTLKEQAAIETGTVIAFGPTCYVGWKGCESPDSPAHIQWGVDVGDKVEFKKYEGKKSAEDETYRYIPDTHILGVLL